MCKYVSKLTAAISFALLSSGYISTSHAAGFALIENSASGQGNAYAGAAAVAEDASTVWFNPAGMMKLSGNQMVLAGHYISTAADFTDTGSTSNPALPGSTLTGTNDDGGESAFVPNFYYVSDIGNETRFGIGITAPFGLSTNYNSNWIGRYTATKSEVHAININPSFASQATDKLSIGFGLNIQYIEATLANQLDSTAICLGSLAGLGATCPVGSIGNPANAANASYDSSQSLSGDDLSYGWNFGLLYDLDKNSRLGFAYRSSIKHLLEGSVDFNLSTELATALGTLGAPYNSLFSDTNLQATVELPESLSVSYASNMGEKLSLLADITWTRWSNFKELTIVFDPIQPASTIPENWDDSYRYSLGMKYKQDDKLTYRAGVAIDRTPIRSPEDRTPRIPGNDRTWLSLGMGYQLASDMSIDVGFSHLIVDDTDMNNTDASFSHTVTGTYDADINILSAQANLKF